MAAFPSCVNYVFGAMLGGFAFFTTVQWTMASYLNLQYVGFEIMCCTTFLAPNSVVCCLNGGQRRLGN